jgi:4-amino-4-deoxy-L-arabinose transferase-like glycosyltransferase
MPKSKPSRFARRGDLATTILSFARRHAPELALCALGVLLRLSMLGGYDIRWSYDSDDHWPYIAWFSTHWKLPPLSLSRETYHPPLYYVMAGTLLKLGAGRGVQAFSFACGCARLGLIWYGIERYLPRRRMARLVALALAAVLPASVHLDGMITGEALSGLLATGALLLGAHALRTTGAARWRYAIMTGVVVGLQLLTKVSALATIGALGLAAVLEMVHRQDRWEGRLRRFVPWLGGLLVVGAVSGWYFARNERLHHKAFLSGFDGLDTGYLGETQKTPYLDRRTLGFFLDWRSDIFRYPYSPAGSGGLR